jgi:hypothetical protein
MDATVAPSRDNSNNERVITRRAGMAQDRWPHITTSVSGISAKDWELFKRTANRRGLTYQRAMERAVAQLIADLRNKQEIVWEPSRPAKSRPIKLHHITRDQVRELAEQINYRQNVIFLTAMMRWCENDGKD